MGPTSQQGGVMGRQGYRGRGKGGKGRKVKPKGRRKERGEERREVMEESMSCATLNLTSTTGARPGTQPLTAYILSTGRRSADARRVREIESRWRKLKKSSAVKYINYINYPLSILLPASCTRQGGVSMCLLFFKSSTGCVFQSGSTSALPF